MSKLYLAHKGLGVYSSAVPLLIKPMPNNEYYLVSAVDHYFSVYRFSDLAIIGTSDRLSESILSMSSTKNIIFCGCQTSIFAFKRARHLCQTFKYEEGRNWMIVEALEEEGVLCGVSEGNMLVMWDIESGEVVYSSQFPRGEFDLCQVIQPRGYSDKLLVASRQGDLHLINYRRKVTLFVFKMEKPVTVLQLTPDDNTVAVGCEDGSVILHNLLYDKSILEVQHDLGPISSVSFREDCTELIMITGSKSGHITMWDVDKARNLGQLRFSHHEAVATLYCVPNKALLITSSGDNSIKVWNYDRPDGTPVLFKSRQGHSQPPSFVDYWPSGPLSTQVVSGGLDSVINVFSTFEEKDSFSMGRAYLPYHGKKEDRLTREQYVMPPPSDIACCVVRDGFWDSMVVCHRGKRQVTSWTFSKRCRGKYYLDYAGFKKSEFKFSKVVATRCAMSFCGNFVVVGYSSGHIVKYNIQSGQERGVFGDGSSHEHEISGLKVGLSGHRMVVVSGDVCGHIRMWDLSSLLLLKETKLPSPVCLIKEHPNKDMMAAGTADGSVYLVQLTSLIVFRKIVGSTKGRPITDLSFAYNSERIVIADGNLIKTFDYIHQKMVDCFKLHKSVTNIVMAANDAFLVTSHEEDLGVYLWALKTQCENLKLNALKDDYEPTDITELPRVVVVTLTEEDLDLDCTISDIPETITKKAKSKATVASILPTFSSHPISYLANLLNAEHVKVMSEMSTRGVSSASFFVPQMIETLEGIKWKDEENNVQKIFETEKKRKFEEKKNSDIIAVNNLYKILQEAETDEDFDKSMKILKKLTPAAVDREIEMMHPMYHMEPNKELRINVLLKLLHNQFKRGKNMDLCELYLAVLLKHNTDCLIADPLEQGKDDNEMETDDPLNLHESEQDLNRKERRKTLAMVNEVVQQMDLSQDVLLSQLFQLEQMTHLASWK